ncbi:MAG: hypothetical protein HOO87_16930 [Methyloglobulus sp.]|nr:hypothetical protein [Methyloglobulus sp.]
MPEKGVKGIDPNVTAVILICWGLPKGLNHKQVDTISLYQSQVVKLPLEVDRVAGV